MAFRIFVGNLSYEVTDDDLRDAFSEFGQITFHRVILDRETQRSRGFGFVEFDTAESGERAISELNGRDLKGRSLRLREAEPRGEGGGGPRHEGRRDSGGRRNDGRRPERPAGAPDTRRPPRGAGGPPPGAASDDGRTDPSRERRRTEKKAHSKKPDDDRSWSQKGTGAKPPVQKQRGGARNRFGFVDEDEDDDIDLFGSYHEDEDYDVGEIEGVEIEGDEEADNGLNLEGIEVKREKDDDD